MSLALAAPFGYKRCISIPVFRLPPIVPTPLYRIPPNQLRHLSRHGFLRPIPVVHPSPSPFDPLPVPPLTHPIPPRRTAPPPPVPTCPVLPVGAAAAVGHLLDPCGPRQVTHRGVPGGPLGSPPAVPWPLMTALRRVCVFGCVAAGGAVAGPVPARTARDTLGWGCDRRGKVNCYGCRPLATR